MMTLNVIGRLDHTLANPSVGGGTGGPGDQEGAAAASPASVRWGCAFASISGVRSSVAPGKEDET